MSSAKNPKVDAFLNREKKWRPELEKLRSIVLSCGLDEEFKWGQPCYCVEGKNVIVIHGFKEYFALLFFKGALMKDPKKLLIQQTENVQSGRQIRFTKLAEVTKIQSSLKAYVKEAVAVELSGAKVEMKKTSEYPVVEEFKKKLKATPALKKAFEALTPGRQRGYLMYFSQAKQAATREARVEKCVKAIMEGKGMLE
jgi:uncharacterized protein YdeI (YjbR/CyaY-like superfamily)